MLHRSAILTAAWKSYRLARQCYFVAGDETGRRSFLRELFGKMLRMAWADAKKAAAIAASDATAAAFVVAQQRVMTAKVAALSLGERSRRVTELRDELDHLDYAPLGVRVSNRRTQLTAELSAFTA